MRPAVLWIAFGCTAFLVILGGVILNRNRSDEATTTADGAVSGPSTGRGESSADEGTPDANAGGESRDVCELLPEDFAEGLIGMELKPNDVPRSVFCSYTPTDESASPKVLLDSGGLETLEQGCEPPRHCEPYPALPDGELMWWDFYSEGWGTAGGVAVHWKVGDQWWKLRYEVSIESPGIDILSKRDTVADKAEEIHQEIMADSGTWGADEPAAQARNALWRVGNHEWGRSHRI